MMRKVLTLFSFLILAMSGINPASADSDKISTQVKKEASLTFEKSLAVAKITSSSELQEVLSGPSPLDALSDESKTDFINGLVFTSRGLASFDGSMLEKELTPTEIYKILQLFGLEALTSSFSNALVLTTQDKLLLQPTTAEQSLFEDELMKHYWCASKATCDHKTSTICITNNCAVP